jgi:hypothetical protein
MKRHSFVLRLLLLIVLGASMNACIIASCQIAAPEPIQRRTNLASKYDGPVYFVIPEYYNMYRCGLGFATHACRGTAGIQMEKGVSVALDEMPLGRSAVFTEHIPSEGLVCIITVNQQPTTYVTQATFNIDLLKELLSLITLGMSPIPITEEYVLSYTLLLDSETVRKYQYNITRKSIWGLLTGVIVPVVYPFWGDEIALYHDGPNAKAIREITKTVLLKARRDGIL